MKKSLLLLGALAALLPSTGFARRQYKYSINPDRAEEILAGIQLNGPMENDRWATMLGGKKNERYTVQPGDTLWSVSDRTVGDPRLWRKIWAMNPDLTNPHDIDVGRILAYYREGFSQGGFEIPLVRLLPNRPGSATDLDSDSVVNLEIKNQFRPSFFVINEEEVLGTVTGAHSPKNWIGPQDDLYLKMTSTDEIKNGTLFSVVRVERAVRDRESSGSPLLGTLVRLLGEVKVIHTQDGLVRAEFTRQLGVVERGDSVIAVRGPLADVEVLHPPIDLQARIVRGERDGMQFMAQGQIVLVSKGKADGVKVGHLFRVPTYEDPVLKSVRPVIVDYKGEVQIVSVSETASIGFIKRNTAPLSVGDLLLAAQAFPEPAPSPRMEMKELEIN